MFAVQCKKQALNILGQSGNVFFRLWFPMCARQIHGKNHTVSKTPSDSPKVSTCGCKLSESIYANNASFFLKPHSYFTNFTLLRIPIRQFSVTSRNFDETSSFSNGNDTKPRTRTIDQVVYHLQADIRRKRRIHKADIHNAVELVEKASKVESFGTFLLNCCCDILPDLHPTYRVKLAERIWAVIQKSKEYTGEYFESMLKVLALNEDKNTDPLTLLNEAKSAGVNTSGTMCFFALLIVCQRGDLESAVEILNLMKDNMIPVNERFFNALMIGNARAGDFKGATDILQIMRASQIDPTRHTWYTLLHVYIEMASMEDLERTFSEMTGSRLSEDQYYELLKAAGKQKNEDVLNSVIRHALNSKKMHALSIINSSLQLMHLGHAENALKILLQFSTTLLTRKEPLGAFFIRELHSANIEMEPETYIKLVKSLQGENNNPYALNMAAELCLKQRKFGLAYRIFDEMHSMNIPVRPHYFLPAFVWEARENGYLESVKVLRKMQGLGLQPEWEMLLNWIIPTLYDLERDLFEVLKTIKDVTGLSYSSGNILSAGLTFAVKEKKIKECRAIAEKIHSKLSHPEVIMDSLLGYICEMEGEKDMTDITMVIKYVADNKPIQDKRDYVGAFILKLLESDRSEEAELLFKHIGNLRIPISQTVAGILKEKISNNDTEPEIDSELTFQYIYNGSGIQNVHVSDMDEKLLECHKLELESKDMNARGTDRKLFLKYCAKGDLENALKLKSNFEKKYGFLSLGMKSSLMSAYVQNKMLEQALELFNELNDADRDSSPVELDTYKIIDLATLMAKKGLVKEAVLVIQENCSSRTIDRPESITRNIVNLLEALSQSGSEDVSKLTQFLSELGLLKPSNPTLAPSIKDLIRKEKLEEATELLEQYTKQNALNPCLQELTYAVIDKPSLLERVIKCSSTCKGEREAKRLLALAKSDLGDIDGAAAGFLELGSELSFISLIKQCEYLSSKREVSKVLNLIHALQKTGRNYDCRKLYNVALQACKRFGDNEGLKRILSSMEEQDLYISQKLKEMSSQKSNF